MAVFVGGEFHSTMKFWLFALLVIYCLNADEQDFGI